MYLSDHEIVTELAAERLRIDGLEDSQIQPASVDLRLGRRFMVLTDHPDHQDQETGRPLDPANYTGTWYPLELDGQDQALTLAPGAFVLAHTWERVHMPDTMLGRLEGKSSLGRIGLRVHSTAGFIDPGFSGRITLELSTDVDLPVVLHPGMRIGQLSLSWLSSRAVRPYGTAGVGSHYQDQDWPAPSLAPQRFTCGLPELDPIDSREAAA